MLRDMSLQSCREQQQFRPRTQAELELIRLAAPGSDPVRARLISIKSKDIARLVFHNRVTEPVRALWLDFDGHEVQTSALPAETVLAWLFAVHFQHRC